MSLTSPIGISDNDGVKWAKLQRFMQQVLDNAGISYTMSGFLTPIGVSDNDGVKWAKLGAWTQFLAENISSGGGGAAAAGTLTGDTLAANVVNSSLTSFGAGVATLKFASVTLTDAQIKGMAAPAYVEILAAPGAGKVILPLACSLRLGGAAINYANIDAAAKLILCATATALPEWFVLDESVGSAVSGVLAIGGGSPTWGFAFGKMGVNAAPATVGIAGGFFDSDLVNVSVSAYIDNAAAGVLTGGNAANTLKVTVWYVEVEVDV